MNLVGLKYHEKAMVINAPLRRGRKEGVMPVNSKRKGKSYELELARSFREHGYNTRRTAQYCGNTGDASDVVGLPGIHIEAKRCEALRLSEWMEQAVRDSAGTGNIPAVFHRRSKEKTLVTLRLDDFMTIYKEFEASMGLKERSEEDG